MPSFANSNLKIVSSKRHKPLRLPGKKNTMYIIILDDVNLELGFSVIARLLKVPLSIERTIKAKPPMLTLDNEPILKKVKNRELTK